MTEVAKQAETKQDIPKQNGVELLHLQEARKLLTASSQLNTIKERQQNNIYTSGEKKVASDELAKSALNFDMGPGKLPDNTQKPKENFVESSEVKDQREIDIAIGEYQYQLKKTYNVHMQDLQGKPEEQKKLGAQYLEGCIHDLKINPETIGEGDVQLLAKSLPDVWKNTLLNPSSVGKDSELKKIREAILDRVVEGAASIDRNDFTNDNEYQQALLDDFKNITGITLSLEEIKKLTQNSESDIQDTEKLTLIRALAGVSGKAESLSGVAGFTDQPTGEDLEQNMGEIIGDNPEFSQLKSLYDGIKEPEKIINEFHAAAGLQAGPSTPWCMSFVQYVLRKHYGYQGPQTAAARDGFKIGIPTPEPSPGDLVLIPRNGGSGYHIAFVEKIQGKQITYFGGNQSNSVCSKTSEIKDGMKFQKITGMNS